MTGRCSRAAGLIQSAFVLASVGFGIDAAWIPVKARVAQFLLQRAWASTMQGGAEVKPWPWADTWPLGRLRMEQHGVDLIVLAGASGRTLAFGPGHVDGTARPGHTGNVVLSGHRDTHFRFLEWVQPGELVWLDAADGSAQTYRVTARHVVYADDVYVLDGDGDAALTLITCYPFDAVLPGGPLRYVVRAELAEEPEARSRTPRKLALSPASLEFDLGSGRWQGCLRSSARGSG
jgi:sortase A